MRAVESAIFFAALCWGSSIRARDSKKLNKLIKETCSRLGTALGSLELIVQRRMLPKLLSVMDNVARPQHNIVIKQ